MDTFSKTGMKVVYYSRQKKKKKKKKKKKANYYETQVNTSENFYTPPTTNPSFMKTISL